MPSPRLPRPSSLQISFEFSRWAMTHSRPPTWQQIQGYLGCSRATACRWRSTWLASQNTAYTPLALQLQLARDVQDAREQLSALQGQLEEVETRLQQLKQRIHLNPSQEQLS